MYQADQRQIELHKWKIQTKHLLFFYRSIFIGGLTSMRQVLGRRGPANFTAPGRHTLRSCLQELSVSACISHGWQDQVRNHSLRKRRFSNWITEALIELKHVSMILFAYHGCLLRVCSLSEQTWRPWRTAEFTSADCIAAQIRLTCNERWFGVYPSGIIALWLCVGFISGPESMVWMNSVPKRWS